MKLVEFFPYWAEVRRGLLDLVDLIPDSDLHWAPDPVMMPFSAQVLHIAETTDFWIGHVVLRRPYEDLVTRDKETGGWRVSGEKATKAAMKAELTRSYALIEEVLDGDAEQRSERIQRGEGNPGRERDLHWVLHHVLDHEIHHRAYVAAYLRMRGVAPVSDAMP